MKKFLLKRNLQFFAGIIFFCYADISAQENLFSPLENLQKVVPNAFASTGGTASFLGPCSNSARTYQMLIAASQLTDLVGKNLISISFRNPSSSTAAWPTADLTFNNYDIYLSGSVNPADRSFTFASNVSGTQTQVRSGSLVIPANAFTFGATPNAFSFDINFSAPWNYAGGNLLIEIRHDGFTGTSKSVDAIGTSGNGYGTLVSACWASSNTATTTTTQGNFCVVNLKTDENLGNQGFEKSKITVYPNPAFNELNIASTNVIMSVAICNLLGQKVYFQDPNSSEFKVDISLLNSGTYIVRMESENEIQTQKIIKQ